MNSRERIQAALAHKEPDRLPVDMGGTIVTTLTRIAYLNLRKRLGLPDEKEPRISHRQMDTVYPSEDMLRHYGIDTRAICMRSPWYFKTIEIPQDDSFYDEFGIRWKKASYYYDAVERPLAGVTLETLDKAKWIQAADPGRVVGLEEDARKLFETTDYCIVADIMCGGPFEQACMLRGYDQFLTDLYVDPKFAEALLDKITETDIELWRIYLEKVGKYVQVVAQGDDVAMQTGTYVSPDMYRKMVKPYQKKMFQYIRSMTDAKIFYHSCGSTWDILPDFIEIGVDIVNPVQITARNMEPKRLKQEFGKDVTFWGGGVDIQHFLPNAGVDEVEDHVRRNVDIFSKGGGYVFFPSHNVQADIAPEKIDRMYQTVAKYYG